MKLRSLAASGVITSGFIASLRAVPHLTVAIIAIALLLALLVFFGVVLPGVWSSKPARRKAAATIFGQILAALRRRE
jgi:hypothetical protein